MSLRVASRLKTPASRSFRACAMELLIWFPLKIGALELANRLMFPIRLFSKRLVTGLIDLPHRYPELAPVLKEGIR
jgi:hypothetical protein